MSINRKLGDLANVLDDGTEGQVLSFNASGKIAASTMISEGTLGTLTQSFDSNQTSSISLSSAANTVPFVSVFKEVPQLGVSSKGQWDVNSNGTNYDFYDEKPISYTSSTLTPSATGDGTFTSSSPIVVGFDVASMAYNNKSYDFTAQTTVPEGGGWGNNGTVFFMCTNAFNRMYSYTASTAYDISTLTYDNKYFAISSPYSDPCDVIISDDGTKFWGTGRSDVIVGEFVMSTAFDLSTATYNNSSLDMSAQLDGNCRSISFGDNGTKLYATGFGASYVNPKIVQYNLSTAYDLSTATYSGNSITYQKVTTAKINADGTKMLIAAYKLDEVYLFTLSTAYDLSTATDSGISYNFGSIVNTTTNSTCGGTTNPDGSEFYFFGGSSVDGNTYQFNMGGSKAFNSADVGKKVVGNSGSAVITDASGTYQSVTPFADTSAISSWQLFGAQGKADGSGIELTGFVSGYDISSPSNVKSWATPASPAEDISSAMLGSDGTKGFYLDPGNDQIVYITLSTAFDISTATRQGSFTTQSSEGSRGLYIFGDGTRIYTTSPSDYVRRYDLSTAWDISTVTYTNNFYQAAQEASMNGLEFKPDGTKMYVCGTQNNTAYQYSLSTAWDITTASYDSKSLSISDVGTSAMDLRFNSDGTKLFAMRNTGQILTYNLSTPYDISTGSYSSSETWVTGYTNVWGFSFANNGTKILISNYSADPDELVMYDTGGTDHPYSTYSPALTNSSNGQINSSSWLDINSMTADETKNGGDIFYAVSTDNRTSWSVAKASDGVRKIVKNNSGTWQYNNNTGSSTAVGFSLASPSYDNKSYSVSHSNPSGMYLKPDGTELYIGAYTGHVYQFTLSTPNDISTASSTGNYNIDEVYDTVALTFKPDGTKMYATGGTDVYQYTLSTAWDITTASYDSVSYTPSDMGSSDIHSLNFNSDGTKLFMSDDGSSDNRIREYSLSTPYVISSASTTSNYLYHNKANVRGVDFSSDGTKIFLSSYSTQTVYQYNLASPYTLSSSQGTTADAEYDASSTISSSMYSMAFSNDGTKLFILESNTDTVKQFSTTTTALGYGTGETWVNGTNNNEHATLQQALGAQTFNRMDKAQLDAVADGYHFSQDSADTLDLMIAPYATSGTSPISDGVTINYDAASTYKQAIHGTEYDVEFTTTNSVDLTSKISANLKARVL